MEKSNEPARRAHHRGADRVRRAGRRCRHHSRPHIAALQACALVRAAAFRDTDAGVLDQQHIERNKRSALLAPRRETARERRGDGTDVPQQRECLCLGLGQVEDRVHCIRGVHLRRKATRDDPVPRLLPRNLGINLLR